MLFALTPVHGDASAVETTSVAESTTSVTSSPQAESEEASSPAAATAPSVAGSINARNEDALIASPRLQGDVRLTRLGSKDGIESYKFRATVLFPFQDETGLPYFADDISFVRNQADDSVILGLENASINGVAVPDHKVATFAPGPLAEVNPSIRLPDDLTGDLLTFDTRGESFLGAAEFSATLFSDGPVNLASQWNLYTGKETAFSLNADMGEALPATALARAMDDTPLERQFWVNTGERNPKIYRISIGDDFPGPGTTYRVDKEFSTDVAYGDIALSRDGSTVYGIQFKAGVFSNDYYLDSYDTATGRRIHRGVISLSAGGQLNSLSVDFDGNLLVAGPKTNAIWKIDASKCVQTDRKCKLGDGLEKLNMVFPRNFTAAGDFVVAPDGGLYGFGTSDSLHALGSANLLYWEPVEPGDPSKGRKQSARNLGEMRGRTFGGGRIENMIVTVDGQSYGGTLGNGIFIQEISTEPNRSVMGRDRVDRQITAEPGINWPQRGLSAGAFWGGTSAGESGPTTGERIIRVEKELPDGRIDPAHQFRLGGRKASFASSLGEPVVTSGANKGLQAEVFRDFVRVGERYEIFEELVDGKGERLPGPVLNNYGTDIRCVEGRNYRPDLPPVVNPTLRYDPSKSAKVATITVPNTISDTITCRFINKKPGLSVQKYPRADREPAEAIQVDRNNRAVLDYVVEVSNSSNTEVVSATIRDTLRLPQGVFADGDATVTARLINGPEYTSGNGAITGARASLAVGDLSAGNEVELADSVTLQHGQTAQFRVSIPIRVEAGLDQARWDALGTCNYAQGSTYQSGGVPNEVKMVDDVDGEANNVACIPLTRSNSVGFQLFKVGVGNTGSPVALGDARFELFARSGDGLGALISVVEANPSQGASLSGLALDTDYVLVETQAPSGYSLLAQPICFRLTRNGEGQAVAALCGESAMAQAGVFYPENLLQPQNNQVFLDANTALISVVDPRAGQLPKTGGGGVWLPLLIGLCFVLCGAAFASRRRT
ncbi:SpaA isopeptide-forming pilin-related protein [Corynebacterium mayonis]|uniref:SpaA isopeptide-forming pilin-related protein n=1 Tax=Corynebacterium mayonis TaxID=3062461 RepID=UPI0031408169